MIFKALFGTCKRRISRASGGFAPCTPTRVLPWTHWGLTAPPDPQLDSAMTYGHCTLCLWHEIVIQVLRGGQHFHQWLSGWVNSFLFFTTWGHRIFCKLYPFIASPHPDINNDPSLSGLSFSPLNFF